ncbi:MAG: hypothetical protein KGJ09_08560 [Candidatus Omnitrophica bacterium]|nr:hypothetical protein [Candidatus Omnitrophota bacterium]
MALFLVLGLVVLIAVIVIGVLFFMLSKEGKNEDEKAVPVKKDMLAGLFGPQKLKADPHEPVAAKMPEVPLPVQEARTPPEDEVYKKRAQELEDELKSISQQAQTQSNEAKQMIQTLTEENESLKIEKARMELAQQKLTELQADAANLKTENTGLQTQLESANARLRQLEEEMAAVKIKMGEEIAQANAAVAQLTQEKETLAPAPAQPGPDDVLRQELESLKSEQLQLKQKYDELTGSHQKLQELNTQLTEKNESLQYELVKAKAQASGLERVSSNYKNQLEDSLRKLNAAQATNDHLSQMKAQLEGQVEEKNAQNEELTKKDQLSQFELEKNRTRLVNLERECEDLKARLAAPKAATNNEN